jgi:outer membrane protein assembly factor BamB
VIVELELTLNAARSDNGVSEQMRCFTVAFNILRKVVVLLVMTAAINPLTACGNGSTMHKKTRDDQVTRNTTSTPTPKPTAASPDKNIPVFTYEVVNAWPHDPEAFTQGLVFHDGKLYESTGHYGTSTLRKLDPDKGKVLKKVAVASQYFAEGITVYQGKIYQLTWEEHKAFVYDLKSLRLEREIAYEGEGWGLALTKSDSWIRPPLRPRGRSALRITANLY